MNGAILGMTKKEIDSKIEDIIEFSEVRQFIDTPVKRYSSGMYVKLAFSVAAHLDSEIMIMDEVLAVGDMAFQKKCLEKMSDVSKSEGRTILYVSHNMNTIRQLCDRVIVLDHGHVVFDGDVEEGIEKYLGGVKNKLLHNDFTLREEDPWITTSVFIKTLDVIGLDNLILFGNKLVFELEFECREDIFPLRFRFTVLKLDRTAVATSSSAVFDLQKNQLYKKRFELDTSQIAPGDYQLQIVAYEPTGAGQQIRHDYIPHAVTFGIYSNNQLDNFVWNHVAWGSHVLPETKELMFEDSLLE